ncbi:hypothetical protein [Streptococcus cristatus]|uniref:hypothetical protein n=1 Tax=Streptococcus cristatus TaxID=45634 RepID=UPI0028D7EA44|nr:hypothetical protein [Streptococcus cristatus]
MLVDLTEENILKVFENVPKEVKDALLDAMGNREFSLSDLANIRKGKIVRIFRQEGKLKSSLDNH